ncbi:unnamed protein product [Peronospora belbahrii]|uniref:SprT-like domain-containing protein n=1 Tax=Peronospora belbahrii TaxID=622444 RepID=A0ABN8DB51_9STRA|nr:unnamed protein product [Peronospora belbahrii]
MVTPQCTLLAPENEYLDPTPDLHSLFLEYNRLFFENRLAGCEVKWSKRMTLCAGLCSFQSRSGFCSIRLSEPLLKYRPRSDMINTLLHEMIHAYVFVATSVRDHEDHGPVFQGHMNRINKAAQTKITIFHTFHEEVNFYRQHVWQCNGPCQRTPPYFGVVKRSMNRAPGPTDRWWADHEQKCGGRYLKIKEPAEFTAKQAKKMARKLACEEKQKKKQDKEAKTIPSVKEFFPTVEKDVMSMNLGNTTRGDAKAPCNGNKARCQAEIATDSNKKRKKERGGDSNSLDLPTLALPSSNPAIFSADADGLYLVGDIQALFQTPRLQLGNRIVREDDQEEAHTSPQSGKNTFMATTPTHAAGSSTVVDLTVSDSDASDNEQLDNAHLTTMSRASADSLPMTGSGKPKVIEIE